MNCIESPTKPTAFLMEQELQLLEAGSTARDGKVFSLATFANSTLSLFSLAGSLLASPCYFLSKTACCPSVCAEPSTACLEDARVNALFCKNVWAGKESEGLKEDLYSALNYASDRDITELAVFSAEITELSDLDDF